jgi:hypothetical protein
MVVSCGDCLLACARPIVFAHPALHSMAGDLSDSAVAELTFVDFVMYLVIIMGVLHLLAFVYWVVKTATTDSTPRMPFKKADRSD